MTKEKIITLQVMEDPSREQGLSDPVMIVASPTHGSCSGMTMSDKFCP